MRKGQSTVSDKLLLAHWLEVDHVDGRLGDHDLFGAIAQHHASAFLNRVSHGACGYGRSGYEVRRQSAFGPEPRLAALDGLQKGDEKRSTAGVVDQVGFAVE